MPGLKFSDFKLQSVHFEARYEHAFLLWDRSGVIWSEMGKNAGNLKPNKAQPNKTQFSLDDRFNLAVEIDKAYIMDLEPDKKLGTFSELSKQLIDQICEHLHINFFKRLARKFHEQ